MNAREFHMPSALDAACHHALSVALANVDPARSQRHADQAACMAIEVGMVAPLASVPLYFMDTPELLRSYADGCGIGLALRPPEAEADFDAAAWRQRCEGLSQDAASGCGASDLLYSRRYSAAVDGAIERFAPEHHAQALGIARECGDYCAPGENDAAWEGCCPHGLDPDCCPCGCGDLPRYSGEDDDFDGSAE